MLVSIGLAVVIIVIQLVFFNDPTAVVLTQPMNVIRSRYLARELALAAITKNQLLLEEYYAEITFYWNDRRAVIQMEAVDIGAKLDAKKVP